MLPLLVLSAQLLTAATMIIEGLDFAPEERKSLTIKASGDVVEGQVVTITCSVVFPAGSPPPKLRWTLQEDSENRVEENGISTLVMKIQKNLTLSEEHDGLNITCWASYSVVEGRITATTEETMTLDVSHPPKDTSLFISPSGPVSVGSVVNLTCSCRRKPSEDDFSWFTGHDGRLDLLEFNTEEQYSFTVSDSDRGRHYHCGCGSIHGFQLSPGHQLVFEGDQLSVFSVQVILKTLGIAMLISALVICECCLRSRRFSKPVDERYQMSHRRGRVKQQVTLEEDYVNSAAS